MEKEELLDRIFNIASFYEDRAETMDNIHEVAKDLEALKVVLNYFDAHYDEYTDIFK